MRPSNLYDDLHTALRFYKNNYIVRTTEINILSKLLDNIYSLRILEFNYISQSNHCSLSYIMAQKQSPGGVLLKNVLRNFVKLTGKHLSRSLFFNKVAGLSL